MDTTILLIGFDDPRDAAAAFGSSLRDDDELLGAVHCCTGGMVFDAVVVLRDGVPHGSFRSEPTSKPLPALRAFPKLTGTPRHEVPARLVSLFGASASEAVGGEVRRLLGAPLPDAPRPEAALPGVTYAQVLRA